VVRSRDEYMDGRFVLFLPELCRSFHNYLSYRYLYPQSHYPYFIRPDGVFMYNDAMTSFVIGAMVD